MAIDSERLRLRPVSPDDVDRLHLLDADPEVMKYVSGGEPTRRDTVAEWVVPRSQAQFAAHGTGMWTASLRSPTHRDTFVGWVQLRLPRHSTERELELSYRIAREHWGAGLAAEAASALIAVTFLSTDTRRIFASAHPEHAASHRVMRKLGMRLSPLSAGRLDGEHEEDVEYELLREQWAATRGRHAAARDTGRHRRANGTAEMTG